MQHRYYQKTREERKIVNFKLGFLVVAVTVLLLCLFHFSDFFLFLPLGFWMLLSILASFVDTPSMVKSGRLKYYSHLLLAEKEKNNQIVIHGGTLFDYYFTLSKNDSGAKRRNLVLAEYLRGLSVLAQKNEIKADVQIKGTTYVLNERTAQKIGFVSKRPEGIQMLILLLNYPALIASKSFVAKKISLPNLMNTRTFTTNIETLRAHQDKIRKMSNILADQNS
ncbi:hypothetical protein [Pseudozobellia sp. WGM2]|uniref:hypothetical protein n=1 Tax=Pseudozobellia sp. WGM2 TaxID=2787625 RepID=UPI001ADFF18A|nr:hypothetical protein [Pseudozobellia sp. WGM2]